MSDLPGSATAGPPRAAATADTRVSTLELFFDLVFVFTITQVARIIELQPGWRTCAQALLELLVIYWMYGGFAWLTNTLGSRSPRQRIVLLLGMAAFFVVSLAVPRAFAGDGVAFGYAYLALTLVHLAGFLIGGLPGAAQAMRRVGAVNLGAAALVLAAGYAGAAAHWWLWGAAAAVQWGLALAGRVSRNFVIDVDHFAERHGLMIIIVLGESLVSVAVAADAVRIHFGLVFGVLCGLAASAAMWWCYFSGEDEAAARAFGRRSPAKRGQLALLGYDLPHVLMLAGVISVAAGSRLAVESLTHPASRAAAALLAGGAAIYLAALAGFRAVLRSGTPWPRLIGALAMLALIPIGTSWGAAQQLLGIALLITALLVVEQVTGAGGGRESTDRAG